MPGPPIGFDIRMGVGDGFGSLVLGDAAITVPIAFKLWFNECNCPATSFMGTAAPSDIEVTSVSPGTATQALPYQ